MNERTEQDAINALQDEVKGLCKEIYSTHFSGRSLGFCLSVASTILFEGICQIQKNERINALDAIRESIYENLVKKVEEEDNAKD